jgi:hypothetical protein
MATLALVQQAGTASEAPGERGNAETLHGQDGGGERREGPLPVTCWT